MNHNNADPERAKASSFLLAFVLFASRLLFALAFVLLDNTALLKGQTDLDTKKKRKIF